MVKENGWEIVEDISNKNRYIYSRNNIRFSLEENKEVIKEEDLYSLFHIIQSITQSTKERVRKVISTSTMFSWGFGYADLHLPTLFSQKNSKIVEFTLHELTKMIGGKKKLSQAEKIGSFITYLRSRTHRPFEYNGCRIIHSSSTNCLIMGSLSSGDNMILTPLPFDQSFVFAGRWIIHISLYKPPDTTSLSQPLTSFTPTSYNTDFLFIDPPVYDLSTIYVQTTSNSSLWKKMMEQLSPLGRSFVRSIPLHFDIKKSLPVFYDKNYRLLAVPHLRIFPPPHLRLECRFSVYSNLIE